MTDRQCPSCGGFCKKECERENVQPEQHSEQWWRHEVSNAWAEGYEKGRASVKQREWVGLTKEEAREISLANRPYVVDMIAALEARLKEKNCVVLSKECYERGCAAYDDRVDEGVMVPKEKNSG